MTAQHRLIETEADLAEGVAHLRRICPNMDKLAALIKLPPLRRTKGGFAGLISIVIAQQLSVAAADTIEARVVAKLKKITPETILKSRMPTLRACGLSGPKIKTLKALANAVKDKTLDFKKVDAAHPDEAREMLTQVSGIGPWTSDIYIMFALGHADVFAPGDLALQEAARVAYGLRARPDVIKLAKRARTWSPWQGVAARLLWAYYARMRDEKRKTPKVKKTRWD